MMWSIQSLEYKPVSPVTHGSLLCILAPRPWSTHEWKKEWNYTENGDEMTLAEERVECIDQAQGSGRQEYWPTPA